MGDDIKLDVTLEEETDDSFRVGVDVLVTDTGGTPLSDATIVIESDSGSYSEEQSARGHGMSRSFSGVPLPATATISAEGYQTVEVSLQKSDAGESIRKKP
jgi:hypothetical protein